MYMPTDDGRWVSEGFERLARIIKDYDTALELRWIPVENRSSVDDRQKPYQIWDSRSNTVVMFASELDTPVDILARLFAGDNTKGDVLTRIEARNDAIKAMEMKERQDFMEEATSQAAFMAGTKLNYFKMNGKKFDSELHSRSDWKTAL